MLITNEIWNAVYDEIQKHRDSVINKIVGGMLKDGRYESSCGYVHGIDWVVKLIEDSGKIRKERTNGFDVDESRD